MDAQKMEHRHAINGLYIEKADQKTVILSQQEIGQFRELIHAILLEKKADYEVLNATLSLQKDPGSNNPSSAYQLLEDAAGAFFMEETALLALRQKKMIEKLQQALALLDTKAYTVCRISGRLKED